MHYIRAEGRGFQSQINQAGSPSDYRFKSTQGFLMLLNHYEGLHNPLGSPFLKTHCRWEEQGVANTGTRKLANLLN